jgi:hypothetical protein
LEHKSATRMLIGSARLLDDEISLDRAYSEIMAHHLRGRAAASTVEAAMLALRSCGVAALAEPSMRRRLKQLNDDQIVEVGVRLRRLNSKIAAPWSPDEVAAFVRTREKLR